MDKISVILGGEFRHELEVEERVYTDLSAGQWESGWHCWDEANEIEYFISDGGEVWKQPENIVVGVAPKIKEAADRFEAMMDEAISAIDAEQHHPEFRMRGIPAGYENDMALD